MKTISKGTQVARALLSLRLGVLWLNERKYGQALECFSEICGFFPQCKNIFAIQSIALHQLGENKKAFEAINFSLKINPESSFGWFVAGQIATEIKLYKKAIAAYQQSLLYTPDDIVVKKELRRVQVLTATND